MGSGSTIKANAKVPQNLIVQRHASIGINEVACHAAVYPFQVNDLHDS